MMQKGYGIGSGISLFMAANACENVVWKAFAPVSIQVRVGLGWVYDAHESLSAGALFR